MESVRKLEQIGLAFPAGMFRHKKLWICISKQHVPVLFPGFHNLLPVQWPILGISSQMLEAFRVSL